jgi:5-methylcytosine-specific restriction endonuclease McrA
MSTLVTTVSEKYEYQNFLITIETFRGGEDLIAFAVQTKYAHLIDVYNYDFLYEESLLGDIEIPEDEIPYLVLEPEDTITNLTGADTTSVTSMLDAIVQEINGYLDIEPKTVVLKQISKKTIHPKSTKKQRGFNQVAWSTLVKLRDGKCTECGSVYDLHAHHIKSFSEHEELRYDVNNGITLCGPCHRKHHSEKGKKSILELIEKLSSI